MSYKNKDWLEDQYINQRKSSPTIAKEVSRCPRTIRNWLKKFNIPIRSFSDAFKGRKLSQEYKNKISGEKSHKWKGDEVGYNAIHVWVRKNKPKPEFCEICGKHGKLQLSNKTGDLIRDIDNFQYVHCSCHRKYDKENKIKKHRFS